MVVVSLNRQSVHVIESLPQHTFRDGPIKVKLCVKMNSGEEKQKENLDKTNGRRDQKSRS
jgi:hypothetical protein